VGETAFVLGLHDRAFTFRVLGGAVEPLGDAPVHFDELLSPSGKRGLRGMSSGQVRGHSMLVGSIEYRWLLSPFFDAELFVDYGGAFDRGFDHFGTDRMSPSFGVGLQSFTVNKGAYWKADPIMGAQLAYSPDDGALRLFFTTDL
jgi:outer membrane protein assembly factor BamA